MQSTTDFFSNSGFVNIIQQPKPRVYLDNCCFNRPYDNNEIKNPTLRAIHEAQKAFEGVAESLNVHNSDDVQALVDEIRYKRVL